MIFLTPDTIVGQEHNGRAVTIALGNNVIVRLIASYGDDTVRPEWFLESYGDGLQLLGSEPPREYDNVTPDRQFQWRFRATQLGSHTVVLTYRDGREGDVRKRYTVRIDVVGKVPPLQQPRPNRPANA